jgi:hypothetical protein
VDDIKLEVGKLSKHWGRSVRERSPPLIPSSASPVVDPKNTTAVNKQLPPMVISNPRRCPGARLLRTSPAGPMGTASTISTGRVSMVQSQP